MKLIVILFLMAVLALAANYVCVIDHLPMTWTGQVQVVDGVLLREYSCVRGHVSWGR